ncbi:MAG: hypothetical protein WAU86_03465 [Oricola sp.]
MDMNDSIWNDGEWVSWDDINQKIQYHEWRVRYPNADISLVPIFEQLISAAEHYYSITGSHLQVYGDIGELYGAITYGIKLHKNYAQGSDGRLGNDFIEVKTITPFNKKNRISVSLSGNFSKLFVVKINADFEISGRLINRADLPKSEGKNLVLRWHDLAGE